MQCFCTVKIGNKAWYLSSPSQHYSLCKFSQACNVIHFIVYAMLYITFALHIHTNILLKYTVGILEKRLIICNSWGVAWPFFLILRCRKGHLMPLLWNLKSSIKSYSLICLCNTFV
uniref:Uncharacterized protein n=1 Tax=Rhizophora mucronata TaxID=61149 RepID=A0A2P2IWK9_RHIMU